MMTEGLFHVRCGAKSYSEHEKGPHLGESLLPHWAGKLISWLQPECIRSKFLEDQWQKAVWLDGVKKGEIPE